MHCALELKPQGTLNTSFVESSKPNHIPSTFDLTLHLTPIIYCFGNLIVSYNLCTLLSNPLFSVAAMSSGLMDTEAGGEQTQYNLAMKMISRSRVLRSINRYEAVATHQESPNTQQGQISGTQWFPRYTGL